MKKYLFFVSLLLTVTFAVNAANILVWNFNPGNYDEYTDPEAGQQINCGHWLKECLTNNGYTFTYHDNTKLPADISSYDIIVATVGYYECWGDNSKIDPADQTKLVDFLNSRGKGLYIEGNDFGYANGTTTFYGMLGAKYDADGDKISSLSGQNGSIVEGKSYNFIQNLSINTYMDEISADGGTMIFQCNANKGRAVTYEGQNNTYKVIYSTFVFGGVREESAKNELMKIYMDYLLGTTPIVEEFDVPFTINNNSTISFSLNQNNCLNFSLTHPARVSVDFYNISGQLVKPLINNSFNEGTHQVNLNSNFNNVSSGEYILNFKADEEVANQIIVISK